MKLNAVDWATDPKAVEGWFRDELAEAVGPIIDRYLDIPSRIKRELLTQVCIKRWGFAKPEKRCPRCKQTLAREMFDQNVARYDGLSSCCRACRKGLTPLKST